MRLDPEADQKTPAPFLIEALALGKVVFGGPLRSLSLPGAAGDLGVLPGHTPALTLLAHGMLTH